jgi:hypothetical protein
LKLQGRRAPSQGYVETGWSSKVNAMKLAAGLKICGVTATLLLAVMNLQPVDPAVGEQTQATWIETKWPFLMDQWGEGKSFQCKAADCGAELNLYIRAKIGFCSSTIGIADDDELERLSDFSFMNGHAIALARGHEIDVAGMKGRIRAYEAVNSVHSPTYAFSVAFNSNSDALVATVVLNGKNPAAMESVIIQFLNGRTIQRWVTFALGL